MTAQTIRVRLYYAVVPFVKENGGVCCGMPAGHPLGILYTVTAFAVFKHLYNLGFVQMNVFVAVAGKMIYYHHCFFSHAVEPVAECSTVAFFTVQIAVTALGKHSRSALYFMA
jgi:hypothetical protein